MKNISDLTAEQRVQKETFAVINSEQYRLLGGIIMMGKTSVNDEIQTAKTDGFNTQYSSQFVDTLPIKELRFLILHEAMHRAKRDLFIWVALWKKNKRLANMACDFVNNLELVKSDPQKDFISMPPNGCLDWRFDGMDAGEVFRILEQEEKHGKPQANNSFDEHDWEAASKFPAEETKVIERQVNTALQQGVLLSKNMGGDVERLVRELLEPKIDWRAETREFSLQACSGKEISTWRKPNRRSIHRGAYLPSTYSEKVGRMAVCVDTSGSIGKTIIGLFLGTVAEIAREVEPEMVDLLYWDVRVTRHEKYGEGEYETITASTKPRGGGGTSPSCVSSYLQKHHIKPDCILILTDGLVGNDWGSNWPAPVLWCIANNRRCVAATGKTLHIEEQT